MDLNKFRQQQRKMSDAKLIEHCEQQIKTMAETYGRSHLMSIPPEITDTDVIFSELILRFKASLLLYARL